MSKGETASEVVAAQDVPAPTAKSDDRLVVAYIGSSDRRAISGDDWDRMGLVGEGRIWSAANGMSIPVDDLTEDEVEWLSNEPDFTIRPASTGPE